MARVLISKSSVTGEVKAFAGTSAPEGYLFCNGQAVSRTTYAGLFDVIGTSHGSGDGSTTFNLPDYRGTFLRGRVDITTVSGSGTASSNNATFTNHRINRTGFKVRLSSGTLSGLATSTTYYAIVVNSNTLAFATSLANAIAGTKIAISGANSAVIVQYEDPNASTRTAYTVGGNSGYNVGSLQQNSLQTHNHYYIYRERDQTQPSGSTVDLADSTGFQADSDLDRIEYFTQTSGPSGSFGVETRPNNTFINYIIKY